MDVPTLIIATSGSVADASARTLNGSSHCEKVAACFLRARLGLLSERLKAHIVTRWRILRIGNRTHWLLRQRRRRQ